MDICGQTIIGGEICVIGVLARDAAGKRVLVDNAALTWNFFDDPLDPYAFYDWLTLADISQQLLDQGYKPDFYVWQELGVSGRVYRFRSDNNLWEEHGRLRGFA